MKIRRAYSNNIVDDDNKYLCCGIESEAHKIQRQSICNGENVALSTCEETKTSAMKFIYRADEKTIYTFDSNTS